MKIKSAKTFRYWYKTKVKEIDRFNPSHNENFVGTYHTEKGKKIKGFFEMYHGDKSDIAGFLPSLLDIAEDGQAIFEFLQNAVDCDSTHFYVFYNEKYFLAINNGQPFSNEDLKGILNIGQGTKLNQDCDKIGRFGIGFKLVHRLVGRTAGVEELTRDYKGPVLFSWHKPNQIKSLASSHLVESVDYLENSENQNLPWLLKILLTNFPTEPEEKVKNLSYQDKVLFPQKELMELHLFLKESLAKHPKSINLNNLQKGSLFFIKLGKGKHQLLEKDYLDLRQGIQYSMNMLKKLHHIYINDDNIPKEELETEVFEISKESKEFEIIDPKYKACNIKIIFGFYADYKKGINKKIKEAPNFYKYFPMGDETNGFSFIIHSDSFSIEANRRKQHHDSINTALFPEIAKLITKKLDSYKKTNRDRFLQIYASILLSDCPNSDNNKWLKSIFYDILLDYLCNNIPTQNKQFSNESKNVKINTLKISLNLADFGLDHIQWFEWENENDFELVKEARDSNKLKLKTWDFSDILLNCDINKTNKFILSTYNSDLEKYAEIVSLINEITKSEWKKDGFKLYKRFSRLLFFPYQNGDSKYLVSLAYCLQNSVLILQSKNQDLFTILEKLDLSVSSQNVDKNLSPIGSLICEKVPYIKDESKFYEIISKQCVSQAKNLSINEKHLLFKHLQELQGIGSETIKNLTLFCNNEGEVKPLSELVDSALSTPNWINPFKIKAEENFLALKRHLISQRDLYQEIILPNWRYIISAVTNISEFYQKTKFYYDQNEKNTPLKKQAFVFVSEDEGFCTVTNVFYNSKFTQANAYKDFQNAIYSLIDTQTPHKDILQYLREAPFKVENSDLFDYSISNNIELSFEELKSLIEFCKNNNERFFENCVIEKQGNDFIIAQKSSDIYQVRPSKKEVKQFIEENFDDTFKILPYEFDEYKNEIGIIKGERLYEIIINEVDVDDVMEQLVDILAYDEPKRKFLLRLTEIYLISGHKYNQESVEYKLLNMACSVLEESDYHNFRKSIVIEANNRGIDFADIPPFVDKIMIGGYKLSLAKILPNTYQNSSYLSELLELFIGLGLSKNKLNLLLNISQEPEPENIFKLLSEGDKLLENGEQLAFILLYNQLINTISTEEFEVKTLDENYTLKYNFYINKLDFIGLDYILSDTYKGAKGVFKEFPVVINEGENLLLFKEPCFIDDKFVCPGICKNMSDKQKLSFIEFLFNQWDKKNKKTAIKNIDWAGINEIETEKLLGFNPNYSVYPSKYALKGETLPKYLQKWLGKDTTKINFIADLGIFTETSTLLALRKFFNNKGSFNRSKLAQDSRLVEDETMLFSTFEWLKEKEFELDGTEEFQVFEEMVRVINSNRAKNGELIIQTEYDFELLESQAEEWNAPHYESWKEELEDKYSIFLFEGVLPKIVKLDEIDDYVFYRYNQGDVMIDDKNNIYINHNTDIKKALQSIISDDNFTYEYLYKLFEPDSPTINNEVISVIQENNLTAKDIKELLQLKHWLEKDRFSSEPLPDNIIKQKSDIQKTGISGEKLVYDYLCDKFGSKRVVWASKNENEPRYDFRVLNEKISSVLMYIDAKASITAEYASDKVPILIRTRAWDFFKENKKGNFYIARIFNINNATYDDIKIIQIKLTT